MTPSTGQPGVDLEVIRRKHWEDGGPLNGRCHWDDADWPCHTVAVLAEVESLRQQLAAAQAERDALIDQKRMLVRQHVELDIERDQLRAQVEELRQRVMDYATAEGTAVAQRNAALNEALAYKYQAEAMRAVVDSAIGVRSGIDSFDVLWGEVEAYVSAFAAASAGQPATPSNRPQPAPSANDSQRDRHTDTQNTDGADGPPGRHSSEALGE